MFYVYKQYFEAHNKFNYLYGNYLVLKNWSKKYRD